MEVSREIYWNVGHGPWTLVPMYLFTLVALAYLVWAGGQRLRIYRQGRPVVRTDRPGSRMAAMVVDVLSQRRVLRVAFPGLRHATSHGPR